MKLSAKDKEQLLAGSVSLTVPDTLAAGQDLILRSGARIKASQGSVALQVGDNLVLDVFRVQNQKLGPVTNPAEMETVESNLQLALGAESFDFAPLISNVRGRKATRRPEIDFPTRISIENKSHPSCTLIQVETPDRLGLLYDLVACLGRNNIYITLSRISTDKGAAIDTFYVTDADTRGKLTDAGRVSELQRQLQEVTMASA